MMCRRNVKVFALFLMKTPGRRVSHPLPMQVVFHKVAQNRGTTVGPGGRP